MMRERLIEIYTTAYKTIEFKRYIGKKPYDHHNISDALLMLGFIDRFELRDYDDMIKDLVDTGCIDKTTGKFTEVTLTGMLKGKPIDTSATPTMTTDYDDTPRIELSKDLFIDKYLPTLYDRTFEQTFFGSAGSGKSYWISQRNLIWLMTNNDDMPICNILVLRNDEVTNYKSTFPLYKQIINDWNLNDLFRITEKPALIEYIPNGNQIIFSGFNNPENLKSITFKNGILTTIHVEEATEIKQYSAMNILKTRLRGKYKGKDISKCIIYSYNPISDMNWVKGSLDDLCQEPHPDLTLNPSQTNGMYSVRVDNRDNIRKMIMHSTHRDNHFLTEDDHAALEAFKDTDPYYYQVYALGNYGSVSADYFNKNNLFNRHEFLKNSLRNNKVIEFIYDYNGLKISNINALDRTEDYKTNYNIGRSSLLNVQYKDDNYQKYINIYHEPQKGHVYCIGSDTSGASGQGTSKYSDYHCAVVLDVTKPNKPPKQVASFRSKCREEELAHTLYCLGMYYNKALLSIEVNFSTYPIKELERLNYPYLFVRQQEDSYLGETLKKFGFQTTRLTRPLLLASLRRYIQESVENIFDVNVITECLTFGRNDKGRLEALDQAHDDLVMAYGIALYSVEQTPRGTFDTIIMSQKADTNHKWTPDLILDYQKADNETKQAMIDEYGSKPNMYNV